MRYRFMTLILAGVTLSASLNAQEQAKDSLLHRDFSFVANSDAWLGSDNAAALTRFKTKNISLAEVYVQYGKGGFVNYDESPRTVQAGANVSSFYRLTDRIILSGSMRYDNFSGRNMTGSAFIQTQRLPFDIVEDSLNNAGTKHRDTYNLMGALSWEIYKGLAIGTKVDFTAANVAKYKDLRHKTKLMDLALTTGVYIPLQPFSLGFNYTYRRNTESVIFSTYASNAQEFTSYINYGPWIGKTEPFSSSGFTDSNREQPMLNEYHGLGLQLGWEILPHLSWFNHLDMAYRKGYYGRKSPYTIVHTNHHSHIYDYQTRLTLNLDKQIHHLDFSFSSENLVNEMNAYRSNKNEQGAYFYQYLDPVKSANKAWNDVHLGYTGYYGVTNELPLWTVEAGANIAQRKQTGYSYPYFRRQDIRTTEAYTGLTRNLLFRKGVLSLKAGFAYKKGKGDAFEDGTLAKPSDKQNGFPTMDVLMYREYKYITDPQYSLQLGLKYAFVLPGTKMKTYTAFDFTHRHTNDGNAYLIGRNYSTGRLTIGCTF